MTAADILYLVSSLYHGGVKDITRETASDIFALNVAMRAIDQNRKE